MRLRVTASMKRQLQDLRSTRTGTLRKGGVMHVPRILPGDEWEALASVQQDALMEASYEDRAKPEPVVTAGRPTNNQADHDAANRAAGAVARQGGRPYLEHKERQVRQVTR